MRRAYFLFWGGLLLLSNLSIAQKQTQVQKSVYFESGSYTLPSTALAELETLSRTVQEAGDYTIDILAYADANGSTEANQKLSENRANAVFQVFAQKGIQSQRTKTKGQGEVGNDQQTADEKAQNRRVDIIATLVKFETVEDIFDFMQTKTAATQSFKVSMGNSTEQVFKAEKGTVIKVPSGAFLLPDGTAPKGDVELRIKEAYSYSDMLMMGLSTMSDGNILETGGMVKIEAFADGKPLILAQNKSINLELPTPVQDGMQLFYGNASNSNGAPTNWEATNIPMIPMDNLNLNSIADWERLGLWKMFPKMPQMPYLYHAPVEPRRPKEPLLDLPKTEEFFVIKEDKKGKLKYTRRKDLKKNPTYKAMLKEYVIKRRSFDRDSLSIYSVQMDTFYRQKNLRKKQVGKIDAFNKQIDARVQVVLDFMDKYTSHIAQYKLNKIITEIQKPDAKTDTYNWWKMKVDMPELIDPMQLYSYFFEPDLLNQIPKAKLLEMAGNSNRYLYLSNYMENQGYAITQGNPNDAHTEFIQTPYQELIKAKIRFLGNKEGLTEKLQQKQFALVNKMVKEGKLNGEFALNQLQNIMSANVKRLGWINCDRFYNNNKPLLVIRVKEDLSKVKVYVVCKSIRSILDVQSMEKSFGGAKVPRGMDIAIVGIKVEDGKSYFGRLDTTAGKQDEYTLSYTACSLKELEEKVKTLN